MAPSSPKLPVLWREHRNCTLGAQRAVDSKLRPPRNSAFGLFVRRMGSILGGNSLYCFRMFWKWRLIFWTFAPLLMRLGPLIFQSHLDPFAQRLLRASPLAIAQHLVTNLKQAIARTSFAIGQERQV